MPSYAQVAASVAARKKRTPQDYCPEPRCLWRTNSYKGYDPCPKHMPLEYRRVRAAAGAPHETDCRCEECGYAAAAEADKQETLYRMRGSE